jgi:hypothetical protein
MSTEHEAPRYVVFSIPLLGPNIIFSTLFSKTLSLRFSLSVSDQVSHPYLNNWQCYGSVYLNFLHFCIVKLICKYTNIRVCVAVNYT